MAFPDAEAVSVTEHPRDTNQPYRSYVGQITVVTSTLSTSVTVTEHERYRVTYLAGGSGGEAECPDVDGRPETGMLYPRG